MTAKEAERLLDEIAGERAKITEQKPDPRFTETCYGKTPTGGDYSVAYYYDDSGNPCLTQDATAVNITEFTKDGDRINETYAKLS